MENEGGGFRTGDQGSRSKDHKNLKNKSSLINIHIFARAIVTNVLKGDLRIKIVTWLSSRSLVVSSSHVQCI